MTDEITPDHVLAYSNLHLLRDDNLSAEQWVRLLRPHATTEQVEAALPHARTAARAARAISSLTIQAIRARIPWFTDDEQPENPVALIDTAIATQNVIVRQAVADTLAALDADPDAARAALLAAVEATEESFAGDELGRSVHAVGAALSDYLRRHGTNPAEPAPGRAELKDDQKDDL